MLKEVSSAVAVFLDSGKLLMEKRSSQRKVYSGFLMCPSGHVNKNETPEAALIREMKEELEIKVTQIKPLFTIKDIDPISRTNFDHHFFLVEKHEGKIHRSNEADELLWMTYTELKKINLAFVVHQLVEKLHEENYF
jgi:8-oxo-dGTP diphosphatase